MSIVSCWQLGLEWAIVRYIIAKHTSYESKSLPNSVRVLLWRSNFSLSVGKVACPWLKALSYRLFVPRDLWDSSWLGKAASQVVSLKQIVSKAWPQYKKAIELMLLCCQELCSPPHSRQRRVNVCVCFHFSRLIVFVCLQCKKTALIAYYAQYISCKASSY